MRVRVLAFLGLGCAVACSNEPSSSSGAGWQPQKIESGNRSVTIRNNCREAVEVWFGEAMPASEVEPLRFSANALEQRKMGRRERLWLRYRGEWSRRRSALAETDGWVLEVLSSCDGVTGRKGPL
jgi:hypothetical protein